MLSFARLLLTLCLLLTLPAIAAEDEEAPPPAPPIYYKLTPSIISNLQSGARYLRADIQLMARDPQAIEALRLHTPALRNELLLLIGDQDGAALKTPKGKEKLRKTALKALQGVMEKMADKPMIEELYFTSFFVQ